MTRFAVNRSLTSRLIVLCACLVPAEVWAQSNPYAWLTGQLALTPEIQTRIINAIDAQAAAKSPTAPARPAVEAQKDPIPLGPVVLDVNDMDAKQLTWRGFAGVRREKGEKTVGDR
jgi:hypothetical protein